MPQTHSNPDTLHKEHKLTNKPTVASPHAAGEESRVHQDGLLGRMLDVYSIGKPVANDALYGQLSSSGALKTDDLLVGVPVGKAGQRHCLAKRKVRWMQQTLRQLGVIEKVPGTRGLWRSVAVGDKELAFAAPGRVLVAFSTKLGCALWADADSVFSRINEPIHLVLTSPPYPLAQARAYGNPSETEFVDFICGALEPMVKNLLPGGSVALNISNDIFLKGLPSRSMYVERTVIALHDRLGLYLQDRIIWHNPTKPLM